MYVIYAILAIVVSISAIEELSRYADKIIDKLREN